MAPEGVKKSENRRFHPVYPIENSRRGTPWRAPTTIFSHLRQPWENRPPTSPEPRQGRKKSRPKVSAQRHFFLGCRRGGDVKSPQEPKRASTDLSGPAIGLAPGEEVESMAR